MKRILVLLSILIFTSISVNAAPVSTEAMLQYNRGIDYYKSGQYDQSVDCFRSAIKIAPNYIDAYYNLGSVLEYLQQYDAALAVFKQIIVRKPDDYDSVYKAAWLSYKLGESQKARTYLALIPPTSVRASDAQTLLSQLPSVPKIVVTPNLKVNQTTGLYQNISAPTGITSDRDGNVYVAEFNNNSIVRIASDNKKVVYAKDPKINGPIGLAADNNGNIYIANYNNDNILKISEFGEISVLISNVKKPYCLYIAGNVLFVSCQGSDSVLRYKL